VEVGATFMKILKGFKVQNLAACTLVSVSRPDLRPTHSPIQWIPVDYFPGVKRGRGVKQTADHLVPRS
jgi:hypothetical protein